MLVRLDLHFGGRIQESDNIALHLHIIQLSEDQKICLLLSNAEGSVLPASL